MERNLTVDEEGLLLRLSQHFVENLASGPLVGRFVEYHWGNLPRPHSVQWLVYSQMFDEFSGELANAINALTNGIRRLVAWDATIRDATDEERLSATHYFIDAMATTAVNLPHVIRARFYFAAAHLCHQANRLKEQPWRDDLPIDTEIHQQAADQYGRHWRRYAKLKRALEKVAGASYRRDTRDFRNAYNHRFSPRFVIGMTELVTRRVNQTTGQVSYGIGGQPALQLDAVAAVLTKQAEHIYAAYDAFKALVREHEAAITQTNDVERPTVLRG